MAEKPTPREFEVLSRRFVHGEVGEVITLYMTDIQEKSLVESGAVKRAVKRPAVADKERKATNG